MDIQGKTVLIIGGWGLVGSAVCRKFMEEHPRRLIVTSLTESEAREAVTDLERLYPDAGKGFFVPWWGNIFVREELKDMPRDRILASKKYRAMIIDDMLEELLHDADPAGMGDAVGMQRDEDVGGHAREAEAGPQADQFHGRLAGRQRVDDPPEGQAAPHRRASQRCKVYGAPS